MFYYLSVMSFLIMIVAGFVARDSLWLAKELRSKRYAWALLVNLVVWSIQFYCSLHITTWVGLLVLSLNALVSGLLLSLVLFDRILVKAYKEDYETMLNDTDIY